MSLLKFKVSWEEDDSTYRNIELNSSQSFYDFHTCIKQSFEFPATIEAFFYISDSKRNKGKAISSIVEKNLRDAPSLSMKKTPVGALVNDPEQSFIYECVHPKKWSFYIEIITIKAGDGDIKKYPYCTKSEGISPAQLGNPNEKDSVMDLLGSFKLPKEEEIYEDVEEDNLEESEESFDEDTNEV